MEGCIIFIRRSCKVISVSIVFVSILAGLFFKKIYGNILAWLSFSSMIALIAGYVAAWLMGIIFVRKLKDYFPEWEKEINQLFRGRLRFLGDPILPDYNLPNYIQQEQNMESIKIMLDDVRRFSFCWVYIPSAILVLLILFMYFQS